VFVRDLESGSETVASGPGNKGYSAISPSGSQLAYGTRVPGLRAVRPPDRQWIALDATRPGGSADLFMARVGAISPTPERQWVRVDQSASHPFSSTDQRFLYYLPTDLEPRLREPVNDR
jgi:hypothetical protein